MTNKQVSVPSAGHARSPMRMALGPLAVFLTLSFTMGCDLIEGDTARLVAGALIHSPAIQAAGVSRPENTTAGVFYGEREPGSDVFGLPPVGILGADVRVVVFAPGESVRDVSLMGRGDGVYNTTSSDDQNLVYRSGASYRVEIQDLEETFEVDVNQAPAAEPPQGIPEVHGRLEPLTVTRSQVRMAFLQVLRLSNGVASQTFSNLPESTEEILDAIASPASYQSPSFEIPGYAFQEPGQYAVVLTTVVRGVPDSFLYSGSGVLVGAGDVRLFTVD